MILVSRLACCTRVSSAKTTNDTGPEACTTKLVQLNLDMLELAGWPKPKHARWR